jgi:hypothetical protein
MNNFIGIKNTFVNPNSPIVLECGYYNIKSGGYKCLTKLDSSQFNLNPITDKNIYLVNSNTLQCATIGNYSVLVTNKALYSAPQIFKFLVYDTPQIINKEWLAQLINSELPSIYQTQNPLNNADNYGSATVLSLVYDNIYQLFYNLITSVGENKAYSANWEYVYIGANNFLQNAVYPSNFLKTMMQIPTQTGISMIQLAIITSKLAFQFTGLPNPVSMYYDGVSKVYFIDIYRNSQTIGWELGTSELGIDTVLARTESTQYSYILINIISKLLPITIKYQINFLIYQDFLDSFQINQVGDNDYIDASIKYDAYQVMNNNNIFNTKGFYKNA